MMTMIRQVMPAIPGWQFFQSGLTSVQEGWAQYTDDVQHRTQEREKLLRTARRLAPPVLSGPATLSQAKQLLCSPHTAQAQAHVIAGNNIVYPELGVVSLPDALTNNPYFRNLHTRKGQVDFDRPLSLKRRLEVLQEITGVTLFEDYEDSGSLFPQRPLVTKKIKDQLTDQEILSLLSFFGEQAVTPEGQAYLIRMARLGWSNSFLCDAEGRPVPVDFDLDDTRYHSWHVADFSVRQFAQAVNHFVFKDGVSRLLHAAFPKRYSPTWGGMAVTTQMKSHVFFIFRMLRHGQLMRVATDGDHFTQYEHLKSFPGYRAAVLGLLPYQQPDREFVLSGPANIKTTREQAQGIWALARHLYDKAKSHPLTAHVSDWDALHKSGQTIPVRLLRRLGEKVRGVLPQRGYWRGQAPVFDDLSQTQKTTIARLLFSDAEGFKPYKDKDAFLARFAPELDQRFDISPVRVDNGFRHGVAGLMNSTQSFVQIEDRHREPISFYGSTVIFGMLEKGLRTVGHAVKFMVRDDLQPFIDAMVDDFVAELQTSTSLGQLPARNYNDEPVLQAVDRALKQDDLAYIDLSDPSHSRGVSGLILQRQARTVRGFDEFGQGFEANYRSAIQAIETLRALFRELGELDMIRAYYQDLSL